MDDHNLFVGNDLNERKIYSTVPDTTTVTELKYIAKVNENNYIAENLMAVEGQTGNCSVGYYHYLNSDGDFETALFYVKNNGGTVVTNLSDFTLPSDFGTVSEIDDTAVMYDYIKMNCHEKVYVMCEDFCKEESLTKGQINDQIDTKVSGYAVVPNSVIGFDGTEEEIPAGYEISDEPIGGGSTDGWNKVDGTLTYSSWNNTTKTGVVTTDSDLTSILSVGMKVKFTQSTIKYGIITAITSSSITLFMGTDYTLANSAISEVFYSYSKSPYGFPMNPKKWEINVSSLVNAARANPTMSTWYNLSNISLSIPTGLWKIKYQVAAQVGAEGADTVNSKYMQITLSTSSSSSTNSDFNAGVSGYGAFTRQLIQIENYVSITGNTTFYLNARALAAGYSGVYFVGSEVPSMIIAECAYL